MASFKSVLSAIGSDVKKVFEWVASPQAQQVIATGEAAVVAIYPAAAGLVALANAGLSEIIKIEGLAAGAGSQTGSGTQKSAAVAAAIAPEVLSYAQKNGLPTPDATHIQSAVNALVAFANSFPAVADRCSDSLSADSHSHA